MGMRNPIDYIGSSLSNPTPPPLLRYCFGASASCYLLHHCFLKHIFFF